MAKELIIPMRPYLDNAYLPEMKKQVIDMFDSHCYLKFDTLITQTYFTDEMTKLRKQ